MTEPKPRPPYQTIAAPLRYEIDPIKGSRFITELQPVTDADAALTLVSEIRNEFPDATHHCWAFRLREPESSRSSDDGEPGGSAGRPILAQLAGRELYDLVAVVVRYFGGTKLGVGGLMRAYGGATAKTLDRAELKTVTPRRPLLLAHSYDDTAAIASALASLKLRPTNSDYGARVELRLEVPDADWERVRDELRNHTAGRVLFLPSDPA